MFYNKSIYPVPNVYASTCDYQYNEYSVLIAISNHPKMELSEIGCRHPWKLEPDEHILSQSIITVSAVHNRTNVIKQMATI